MTSPLTSSYPRPSLPSIYLDQNVISDMVNNNRGNWRKHETGQIVEEAKSKGHGEVWLRPTHVIETSLVTDRQLRQDIAGAMLDMIECRRMAYGHDAEAVDEFFTFCEQVLPGSTHQDYFRYHADTARQIYLGALGILAATGAEHAPHVSAALQKHKAINRLLHARFAVDPDDWIETVVNAVDGFRLSPDAICNELEGKSIEDIEAEIRSLESSVCSVAAVAKAKLEKNRDSIARAYGAIEVGTFLPAFLPLDFEIQLSFKIAKIIKNWNKIMMSTGCA